MAVPGVVPMPGEETVMGPPLTTLIPLGEKLESGDLQLFCRARPGSGSPSTAIGACPFSQRCMIAIEERGLPHVVTCIDTNDLPDWLLAIKRDPVIPCLRDGDEFIFGADDINLHLNERYSRQSRPFLVPPDLEPKLDQLTMVLLDTFVSWVETRDKDDPVGKDYDEAVKELNRHLDSQGPYLAGKFHTDADFKLGPILHHARVTLRHLYNFEISKRLRAFHMYMELLEGRVSFIRSARPDEEIVEVWTKGYITRRDAKMQFQAMRQT